MKNVFDPIIIENLKLPNRLFMAPMTRNRAPNCVPTELMAEYYAQRAEAGLIISEGSQISAQGAGYPATPGIYNQDQVAGWKAVTDAVHERGGHMFCQLWHCGRISHPDFHAGELPVAPSAIKPAGQAFTYEGLKDFVMPRALETSEIPGIVTQYRHAAATAIQAGFDGIELHAANGYLLDQFLRDGTNQRTDNYGGSIENRMRLLMAVVEAVCDEVGRERVGVRISPVNAYNDIQDSNPQVLFNFVAEQLNAYHPAYLHVVEVSIGGDSSAKCDMQQIRDRFDGVYIANGGYDKTRANDAIASGAADAVAIGIPFLANPDLLNRFRQDSVLNEADQNTFYGGDEHGYTDYPTLDNA